MEVLPGGSVGGFSQSRSLPATAQVVGVGFPSPPGGLLWGGGGGEGLRDGSEEHWRPAGAHGPRGASRALSCLPHPLPPRASTWTSHPVLCAASASERLLFLVFCGRELVGTIARPARPCPAAYLTHVVARDSGGFSPSGDGRGCAGGTQRSTEILPHTHPHLHPVCSC